MYFKLKNVDLNHDGWFVLQYLYVPKNYIITFESEFNGFDINITNEDGGYISFVRLSNCNTNLTSENVKTAINHLHIVLKQEISFFKVINDKLYKQVDGEYKRIKDWRKL